MVGGKEFAEVETERFRDAGTVGGIGAEEVADLAELDLARHPKTKHHGRVLLGGTLIVAERDPGHQVVVGIAGTKGFTVVALEKALMNSEIGFARKVLDVFATHGISIEHMPTGIDTMSVIVSDKQLGGKLEAVLEDLQGAVRPDSIKATPGMALIATVPAGIASSMVWPPFTVTVLPACRICIPSSGCSAVNLPPAKPDG